MKTSKKKKEAQFSILIKIGDYSYSGTGSTPLQALQAIPKPQKIMAKGVFCITDGVKTTRDVLMQPIRLRRLFYNKLFQEIQLKSLVMGLQ